MHLCKALNHVYITYFYTSYSFLNVPIISQYATHFSISVYHIVVSYTTLIQHLQGPLQRTSQGTSQEIFSRPYRESYREPRREHRRGSCARSCVEPYRGFFTLGLLCSRSCARPCNRTFQGILQRNFASDLATEPCRGLAISLSN